MTFILVDSSILKPVFEDFCKLLSVLVGPHGNLCLISSNEDTITLTSSSLRLTSSIPFENPILQFALQCVKSQTDRFGDAGLYCGILLSKLVICVAESSFSPQIASCLLAELKCLALSKLQNCDQLCMKIHLTSVQPLIALARSVLFSKCKIFKNQGNEVWTHANHQVSLLVKAFLQSEASVNRVLLSVHEKSDAQCLLDGVLYQCNDDEYKVLKGGTWQAVSLLLVSTMLTDNLDPKEKDFCGRGKKQLEAANYLVEKAVACDVRVLACQKVVHPSIVLCLRRKGIIVLQRLGKQMTEALALLTGAIVISNAKRTECETLTSFMGQLKSMQHVEKLGEHFLLLKGDSDARICTLMLTSRFFGSEELKVAARQVLLALSQVLQDSVVCPGAGCTEMWLYWFILQEIRSQRSNLCEKLKCTPSQLDSVMMWFQEGILSAAGLDCRSGKLASDSIFHHAWEGSTINSTIVGATSCNCGFVSCDDVRKFDGFWTVVSLPTLKLNFSMAQNSPRMHKLSLNHPSILNSVLDIRCVKYSAIGSAIDNCIAITNIGAIISRGADHC